MELDTDDDVLQLLASGNSMDYEQWPGLFSRLVPRLEKIVREDFPTPKSFILPSQPLSSSPASAILGTQNEKENAPPPLPPLPKQLQNLLDGIISTLNSLFTKYPPHTIQRLAELILKPKQHYRTLASYLHALDRVVHVTSGANVFPLPPAIPDPSSFRALTNGNSGVDPLSISWGNPASTPTVSSLGADEISGSLLTPISWLTRNGSGSHSPQGEVKTESTEMIEGPNGPGGIETVSVSVNGISSTTNVDVEIASLRAEGGITQGELLRQEQRAGVVPAAQLAGHRGDTDGHGEDDEVPHARGPDEIGMEDMGPQAPGGSTSERAGPGVSMQGIDVEAAVGRKLTHDDEKEDSKEDVEMEKGTPSTPKREADEEIGGEEKKVKSDTADDETKGKDVDLPDQGGADSDGLPKGDSKEEANTEKAEEPST